MSHERKMLRHTVLVTATTTTTGIFTHTMSCPFPPDEMKVKQLSFFRDGGTTIASQGAFSVHIDGLGSGGPYGTVLGTVIDPCVSFPGVTHAISGFSNGQYTFSLRVNGVPTGVPVNATLNIVIEFRKCL